MIKRSKVGHRGHEYNVVVYEDATMFFAQALEKDFLAAGTTEDEAMNRLHETINNSFLIGAELGDPECAAIKPAPPTAWAMWHTGKRGEKD